MLSPYQETLSALLKQAQRLKPKPIVHITFPEVTVNNFNERTSWQQPDHFARFLSNRSAIRASPSPSPPEPLRTPSPRPPMPYTSLPEVLRLLRSDSQAGVPPGSRPVFIHHPPPHTRLTQFISAATSVRQNRRSWREWNQPVCCIYQTSCCSQWNKGHPSLHAVHMWLHNRFTRRFSGIHVV